MMDTEQKLAILTDAAKYDVACTSSGVDRDAKLGHLGATTCAGICHSFAADGRCITLLKVLFTNSCAFDCVYCVNRRSNDRPRASFTTHELADLTIEFYRRNYIEGLFVSSAVLRNPDYTMEQLIECTRILREDYGFNGYIHAKAIPGCSPELIDRLGMLVDRLSVNIELPSSTSLKLLAPDKDAPTVTHPMGIIRDRINANREDRRLAHRARPAAFAPAGQSTQLIVGATPEDDRQILRLSSALYRTYELKRVFFSAYLPANDTPLLPDASVDVPLDREHRLYQADWLMRFYGFDAEELIDDAIPWLDLNVDPKANWALKHLDRFPIEINNAPYELLLRIPGLGVTGAKKIMRARRYQTLRPENLRKMGVAYKRMRYFITCGGRYESPLPLEQDVLYRQLAADGSPAGRHRRGGGKNPLEGQLSLFDSPKVGVSSLDLPTDGGTPLSTHAADMPKLAPGNSMPALQVGQLQAFDAQKREIERRHLAAAS